MNRRHFLKTAALGSALPALGKNQVQASMRVIDTHTHFYDPTRPEGVPWPPKGTPLHRKVMPADWKALANPLGIRETVIVEASPWVEDNQWILDLAAQEKCIVGFVGNLDPNDPDFAANLKRFSANPLFRGVRWRGNLVQLNANEDKVLAGAKRLADYGLELDVNGPPDTLPLAAKLAADVPDLRIVINHVGSAGDPKALKPEWQTNIQKVAIQPNVFMKVSGLMEQVKGPEGQAPQETDYYLPILDHLWDSFGADRLIYGSNWPVSDRGAPYEAVFNMVSEYFHAKGLDAAEKYFWKNSLTAYRWIERS
ncbi:MAG: amidohydrolase family protein [Prosthecobacter sp.]|nr:amidohydrolase family protein [Prosthecobacter sp.]